MSYLKEKNIHMAIKAYIRGCKISFIIYNIDIFIYVINKMKRKKLLIAAGLALSAACYAQDNVTVNTASGQKVYKMDDIESITFDGATMKVNKNSKETETINLAEITNISFDVSTGVNGLKVKDENLLISVKSGSNIIEIGGYDNSKNYSVDIFNTAGAKVLGYANWRGEQLNISSLSKGVYVLKINNTTLKFSK